MKQKLKSNSSNNSSKDNTEDTLQYNIAIVIGPEGGIAEKEIEMLAEKNARFVSLGKRILRTETAGLVMAGNVLYMQNRQSHYLYIHDLTQQNVSLLLSEDNKHADTVHLCF